MPKRVETKLLSQRRREEAGTIAEGHAIVFHEFPTGGGLPGPVPAKLLVMVFATGRFKRIAKLLLTGQIQAGVITLVGIR